MGSVGVVRQAEMSRPARLICKRPIRFSSTAAACVGG